MHSAASAGKKYDAIVIGAGPNGLSAAIELARSQLNVLVVEARSIAGGGARTEALTHPGFSHDVCSTVHPLGVASPFFRTLGLERYGLAWIDPPAPLVHLLDDGSVITLERSIEATSAQLGCDAAAYEDLLFPIVERFQPLLEMILGPLRVPSAPMLLAKFGLLALPSFKSLSLRRFRERPAAALLAGVAAHATLPLDAIATSSFALILAAAGHSIGWPLAAGGSQSITRALLSCLGDLGGEVRCGYQIRTMADLPQARAYVFDVTPAQLLEICGSALPEGYRRRLSRFKYGPGVYKIDWALREPIPWRDHKCLRAATLHLSGDLDHVQASEAAVHSGRIADPPFTILVQPSLFDPARAPAGAQVAWAYCHVPHGSTEDMADRIESHIEGFAPGFRDVVLARSVRNSAQMEAYNPNYVGGDINGGQSNISQLFFRPTARMDPYSTPNPSIYICSSSTPPGGGVHGMCGYWAARSVLGRLLG